MHMYIYIPCPSAPDTERRSCAGWPPAPPSPASCRQWASVCVVFQTATTHTHPVERAMQHLVHTVLTLSCELAIN